MSTMDTDLSISQVKWPADLRSLTLGRSFDQPLQGGLPGTLQSLTLGDSFNQSLRGLSWPSSLQSLTLGNLYNQDWVVLWFRWKTEMWWRVAMWAIEDFNPNMTGRMFVHLQFLLPGVASHQDLEGVSFPQTLTTLTFGDQFNRKLDAVCFPAGFSFQLLGLGSGNLKLLRRRLMRLVSNGTSLIGTDNLATCNIYILIYVYTCIWVGWKYVGHVDVLLRPWKACTCMSNSFPMWVLRPRFEDSDLWKGFQPKPGTGSLPWWSWKHDVRQELQSCAAGDFAQLPPEPEAGLGV